jgi:hypothetical protein
MADLVRDHVRFGEIAGCVEAIAQFAVEASSRTGLSAILGTGRAVNLSNTGARLITTRRLRFTTRAADVEHFGWPFHGCALAGGNRAN